MPTFTFSVTLHCQKLSYIPNISSVPIYNDTFLHALVNLLTPELNPSAQRCLTRFLLVILHFVNIG
jgi:hypothetical protein